MLSKGTELFQFEGTFFKLKQKYINREMTDEDWKELLVDANVLLMPYVKLGGVEECYVWESFKGFCEFLGKREECQIQKEV